MKLFEKNKKAKSWNEYNIENSNSYVCGYMDIYKTLLFFNSRF